jgi:hypothetical protein
MAVSPIHANRQMDRYDGANSRFLLQNVSKKGVTGRLRSDKEYGGVIFKLF